MFYLSFNLFYTNSEIKSNSPMKTKKKKKNVNVLTKILLLPIFVCNDKSNIHLMIGKEILVGKGIQVFTQICK